tara:strand:+ start:1327 stop:1842 length:516 start_codon:yes stop_codon:yes gene_type:complete
MSNSDNLNENNNSEEIEIDIDQLNEKIDKLLFSENTLSEKILEIDNKFSNLDKLFLKLEKFEKSVISINAELINQNVKLTNENKELKIQLENININQNTTSSDLIDLILPKELFYKLINNKVRVSGNGTYDVKEILKSLGACWNDIDKVWEGNLDINLLKEKCPHIKQLLD